MLPVSALAAGVEGAGAGVPRAQFPVSSFEFEIDLCLADCGPGLGEPFAQFADLGTGDDQRRS